VITVKVSYEREKVRAFSMEGHAETAEYGKDLVCAAVSGIVQAALLGLHEYLKVEMDWTHKAGKVEMRLLSKANSETEAILQTMLIGLRKIREEYPETIKIFEK
jgi:Predicted ribosomal protein